MGIDEFFIERRDQGDYAIRRPNSDRASGVEPTQAEAIDRALEIGPAATEIWSSACATRIVERVTNGVGHSARGANLGTWEPAGHPGSPVPRVSREEIRL